MAIVANRDDRRRDIIVHDSEQLEVCEGVDLDVIGETVCL